ncbi:MAG: Asp-tRNA(Asn)/Glu-tRNA(Gln) amidotransferase subunit GatB [bacterium]|nr:Asp-tRNA(Asn)/Glu-tRNA(Gln) amidotransferase subunit GatB [bacterium]
MNYTPVIGLEVHVELKTKSKMFCSCKAEYFGDKPNTNTCPVCLGLPGALPVPNKTAIEWCVMIGLALNCKIPQFSKFDRKNYFYPDLPKGYQISQYDKPFCTNGYVILNEVKDLDSSVASLPQNDKGKKIKIRRVHMEEDTAKLVHQFGVQSSKFKVQSYTLIDFNRSGVPLVEIVTEPDFESAEEVVEYLKKLQQIVRYLGVSDADMEKGEMRLEPNISLQATRNTKHEEKNVLPVTSHVLPPYKVEVKNINSFKFVEKAINYEIERQKDLLNNGKTPIQETRGWDEKKQITVLQRIKEEANDYRYFPEPDIPPIHWNEDQISIRQLADQMPELPDKKLKRFINNYLLSYYDSEILTREKALADYFETAVRHGAIHLITPKQIANAIINKKIDIEVVLPSELIQSIITSSQTIQIDEEELKEAINKLLKENQKAVVDYKAGKKGVLMFLVGQTMRKFPKNLDAKLVTEKIKKMLE